jgi:hypothetical protein
MSQLKVHPRDDGIKHLNVYTKGVTVLGRWLSNFTHSPFTHPEYGKFESMEGFYYWVSTGMSHHTLKSCWGFKAKEEGKKYNFVKNKNFYKIIKSGIKCKINQNKEFKERFIENKLPFEHYYYYGNIVNAEPKIIVPPGRTMLINILEELKKEFQEV